MQEHLFARLGVGRGEMTFWPEKRRNAGLATRTAEGGLVQFEGAFLNDGSEDCMGGHGVYGTVTGFLKVLRSLLRNDGVLLRPETVGMMFEPQLDGECRVALQEYLRGPWGFYVVGEVTPELEVSWGLGGMLHLQDDVGRRRRGTLRWGGICNTFWSIDPAADLALVFATQVIPPGDKLAEEMISAVEHGVNEMATN